MLYTENKNMNLPGYEDVIDVEDLNENFKTIDAHFSDPEAHPELMAKVLVEISALRAELDALVAMLMGGNGMEITLATDSGEVMATGDGEEIAARKTTI